MFDRPACGNCRYGYRHISGMFDYYQCRRRAPVKVKNENGWHAWPHVTANDWCGDYEKGDDAPRLANV